MNSASDTTDTPPIPDTIRLGQIAIAAGRAGHSLTLAYRDFPAPLMAEIWKSHAQQVGDAGTLYIENRRDLRNLSKNPSEAESDNNGENPPGLPRLVTVRDPHLLEEMAWASEMCQSGEANTPKIRPAVFANAGREEGDAPGARLNLYASPEEEQKIVSWLRRSKEETGALPTLRETTVVVQFPEIIENLCWPTRLGYDAPGLQRWRDCGVLRALLAGACILRHQDSCETPTMSEVLQVNAEDYEAVFPLLVGKLVRPADEMYDPIAIDMVARANAYLKMVYKNTTTLKKSARMDKEDDINSGSIYRARQITRSELADLGNPRSKVVREIVRFVIKESNGLHLYCKLGLTQNLPSPDAWPEPKNIEHLTTLLRPWSYKQVRTAFDRLKRNQLIEGQRDSANGPWRYTLPEDFKPGWSAFCSLPKPRTIRTELSTSKNIFVPDPACPDCPSLAQAARQTEVQH